MLIGVVVLAGCGTASARRVASVPDFHATQDRADEARAFATVEGIAREHLRPGMTPHQVEAILGRPEAVDRPSDRVTLWTHLVSISGTWAYVTAFLDGRLEFFGEANPQWLADDDYVLEGAERLQQALREERRRQAPTE